MGIDPPPHLKKWGYENNSNINHIYYCNGKEKMDILKLYQGQIHLGQEQV